MVILIIGAITAVIPFVTRLLLNVDSRYHTCDASWYDRFHIVDRSQLKSVIVVLYIIAAPQLVAMIMSLLLDAKVSLCNYSSDRRMSPRADSAAALLLIVTLNPLAHTQNILRCLYVLLTNRRHNYILHYPCLGCV